LQRITQPEEIDEFEVIEELVELEEAQRARAGRKRSWRVIAAVAAGLVAIAVLGMQLGRHRLSLPPLATFSAPPGAPVWTVEISSDWRHMTVNATAGQPPFSHRYQLWTWPENDADPVLLVPVPVQGAAHYDLDAPMQQALMNAQRNVVVTEAHGRRWVGPPLVALTAQLQGRPASTSAAASP
jgi:anti-sigma-K factor RskA